MSDLTDFLLARIAEDEAAAQAAGWHAGVTHFERDNYGQLLANPARVLAECAALREVVEGIVPERDPYRDHPEYDPEWALRSLAGIWHDHPDYLQEWKP